MRKHVFFAKKRDRIADLFIYSEIGEGWFGGISANQVADQLKEIGDVDELHIYINSPGGSVFDGVAIFNQLKRFKAKKIVHIDALAASIASVIAMCGDEVRMARNAQFMIHNAWGLCVGNAEEMRKNADVLDQIDETIVDTYVQRTKAKAEDVRAWMASETWLTAAQAKERGFCDVVEDEDADPQDMAFPMLKNFKNVPPDLAEASRDARLAISRMQMGANRIRQKAKP